MGPGTAHSQPIHFARRLKAWLDIRATEALIADGGEHTDRTDKSQSMADKVAAVEKLLAEDEAKEGKRKVA